MARYDNLKNTDGFKAIRALGYSIEHARILMNSELLKGAVKQLVAGRKPPKEFIYSANSYLSARRAGLFNESTACKKWEFQLVFQSHMWWEYERTTDKPEAEAEA